MNNKLMAGLLVGFALLIGFAAGRLTASSEAVTKDSSEKNPGKAKLASTKRTTYRMPNANAKVGVPAEPQPEAPASDTNRFGRGRGNFDPAAYATMVKERATAERTAFFTSAALTPAQQQDFDDLVTAMNSSLKQRAEKFTAMMKEGKPPSPEAGYQMLHEYASSMMRSYEMLDRTMPPGWREKAGNSFDLRTFVDPEIRMATRGFSRGGPPGGSPGGDRSSGGGRGAPAPQ